MKTLTNSRLGTYQRCQHADWIQYGLRVRRTGVVPLRVGSAFHNCIDLLKGGKSLEEALHALATEYMWRVEGAASWKKDELLVEHEKVRAMATMYEWMWRDYDLEIIATEQSFEVPIINPKTGRSSRKYRYAGKIDGIAKTSEGEVVILEHKTTRRDISTGSDYWKSLRLNSQVSLYYIAAHRLGYEPTSILFDVAKVPQQQLQSVPLLDADGFKQVVRADNGERVYLDNGKPRQAASKENGWELKTTKESTEAYCKRVKGLMEEAPNDWFKRVRLPRLERDLEDMEADLWDVTQNIIWSERLKRHPKSRNHCLLPSVCPNMPFCAEGEDPLADPLPENFVRLTVDHPELEDTGRADV